MQQMALQQESKLKSFTNTLLRKIRKIEYKNVQMIPGYENTEKEYLAMRQAFYDANSMIKSLMHYEHGNKYLKMLKNGVQSICESASVNLYKSKDVYQDLSGISRRMSMMDLDPETKLIAEKSSDVYQKISASKEALNAKLESIRLQLKEKRSKCGDIDKHRKNVKQMRFDLEVLLQDSGYNGEIRDAEKKEFASVSSQVMKMMIQFIDESAISSILKNVSTEYSAHLKESAELLKKSGINSS